MYAGVGVIFSITTPTAWPVWKARPEKKEEYIVVVPRAIKEGRNQRTHNTALDPLSMDTKSPLTKLHLNSVEEGTEEEH